METESCKGGGTGGSLKRGSEENKIVDELQEKIVLQRKYKPGETRSRVGECFVSFARREENKKNTGERGRKNSSVKKKKKKNLATLIFQKGRTRRVTTQTLLQGKNQKKEGKKPFPVGTKKTGRHRLKRSVNSLQRKDTQNREEGVGFVALDNQVGRHKGGGENP